MNFCLSSWRVEKDFSFWLEGSSVSVLQLRFSFRSWLSSRGELSKGEKEQPRFFLPQGVRSTREQKEAKKKTSVGLKDEHRLMSCWVSECIL